MFQSEIRELDEKIGDRCFWDFSGHCTEVKPECVGKSIQEKCIRSTEIDQHFSREMQKRILAHALVWQRDSKLP